MGKTNIQWTDFVWNVIRGCSRKSEGCRNCFAERIAARFSGLGSQDGDVLKDGPFAGYAIMTDSGPRWTGRVELIESKLMEPRSWRKPRRMFVNSMSDMFHEKLDFVEIDRVWQVMLDNPQHTYQILTKRPERMQDYFSSDTVGGKAHFGNAPIWIHLGVSVEDQDTANERIPLLLRTPAAKRFVSYEPALGPVDFRLPMAGFLNPDITMLDQIIVGGESGPGARPCRVEWIEYTIAQCKRAGVACFVKQLGSCPIWAGAASSPIAPVRGKGDNPDKWPEVLRVRELI